jgi:methylenetetrahydrofolate dehydrogenase (NADP+)/methenyltetrahydrofolate cyclohydrolase
MTAQLLTGKPLATLIENKISAQIDAYKKTAKRSPCLAVILIGDDPASEIYVRNKHEACKRVGITPISHLLPSSVSEAALITLIEKLNADAEIDGILLQLPLPTHINPDAVLETIHPQKDVDGFHPYNLGRLAQRKPLLRPCTPYGIIMLLESIGETFKNRHAVIIGASNIVGRPMALELLLAGCTITVCHSLTADLKTFVQQADLLVCAVGSPHIIKGDWIKKGATVIDVGINRLADGSITGDVEFETAINQAAWITPVPGGVGPMTVATLLKNTFFAYESRKL